MVMAAASGPTAADWISAAATAFSALMAAVTTVVAILAALYARNQWRVARQAREDAQAAEVERSQPYVAVFLEVSGETFQDVDIVVQNFGPTGAYNVRCDFGPDRLVRTETTMQAQDGSVQDISRFDIPHIPFLAPGQQWRTWFDSGLARYDDTDLPDTFAGAVRYQGLNNDERHHEVLLDFGPLKARTYRNDPKTLNDVVRSIDKATSALEAGNKILRTTPRGTGARFGQPNP